MKSSITIILAIFFFNFSSGQDILRNIVSHENMHRLEAFDPTIIDQRVQIEQFIAANLGENFNSANVNIPVVFHILYNNEEENISLEQLESQLEALNDMFDRKSTIPDDQSYENQKYSNKLSAMKISFCFGKQQGGQSPSSIIRKFTDKDNWLLNDEMKISTSGGSDPWDTQEYLNIWIVDLGDHMSGFSQMPGGPAETDGIVIDYEFVGSIGTAKYPYDQGKTLAHLVGNYLGLYSLWGDDFCKDDFVYDTPIHNTRNYQCGEGAHISLCDGQKIEMTRNYMDNTPDDCMSYFTIGQKARIHTMLSDGGPRASVKSANNLCENNPSNLASITETRNLQIDAIENSLNVYPNPALGRIHVRYKLVDSKSPTRIDIIDLQGRSVHFITSIDPEISDLIIDLDHIPSGLYFLNISQKGNVVLSSNIVLNN